MLLSSLCQNGRARLQVNNCSKLIFFLFCNGKKNPIEGSFEKMLLNLYRIGRFYCASSSQIEASVRKTTLLALIVYQVSNTDKYLHNSTYQSKIQKVLQYAKNKMTLLTFDHKKVSSLDEKILKNSKKKRIWLQFLLK